MPRISRKDAKSAKDFNWKSAEMVVQPFCFFSRFFFRFGVTNVASLLGPDSCNCMPHMLSYMRLYNACLSLSSALPLPWPPWPPSTTRQHNNKKKRFTRLNVGKLTTRSVSGFTTQPQHTHTHIQSITQADTHTHTEAYMYVYIKAKGFLLCLANSFD